MGRGTLLWAKTMCGSKETDIDRGHGETAV